MGRREPGHRQLDLQRFCDLHLILTPRPFDDLEARAGGSHLIGENKAGPLDEAKSVGAQLDLWKTRSRLPEAGNAEGSTAEAGWWPARSSRVDLLERRWGIGATADAARSRDRDQTPMTRPILETHAWERDMG